MAAVDIYGATSSATVEYAPQSLVYARSAWTDEWEWVPYLYPVRIREGVGSQGSHCELRYEYGTVKREDYNARETAYPEPLMGNFVKVTKQDAWGEETLFIGYCVDDQDKEGHQTFRCVGMEYFLETKILWSVTEDGTVDRPIRFNAMNRRGFAMDRNRTASALTFGANGEWTNLNILYYLKEHFLDNSPVEWHVTGEDVPLLWAPPGLQMMHNRVEVHDLWGLTVREALDRLIEKHRGLGWRVDCDDNYAWITTFSLFSDDIYVGDKTVLANTDISYADLDGSIDILPTIRYSNLDRYNKVVAVGGPVYVCGTFQFSDGSLIADWDPSDESAYTSETGDNADIARQAAKYESVFTRFKVPQAWGFTLDGENASPDVDDDGKVLSSSFPAHYFGHIFEREIPFYAEKNTSESGSLNRLDFREPFAAIYTSDGYQFVDKLKIDEQQYGFSLYLGDRELSFRFTSPDPNHVLAKNHWAGNSSTDVTPAADYETLQITAMWESDVRLRAVGVLTGLDQHRVLTINMPDCVAYYVVPGTVSDVQDGALVTETGGTVDTDRTRLLSAVRYAAAWYGVPRNTMHLEVRNITSIHPIGSMILAAGAGGEEVDIGTVVTQRTYDFVRCVTSIETGHGEIRFEEL